MSSLVTTRSSIRNSSMVNLRSNLSMSLRTHVLPRPYSDSLLCPEQWKSKTLNRKLKSFYFNTYTYTHTSTQLTNMIGTLVLLNVKTDKQKCWILLDNFKICLESINYSYYLMNYPDKSKFSDNYEVNTNTYTIYLRNGYTILRQPSYQIP